MKILLLQSYVGPSEAPVYPLALACLKSALAGHDVRLHDPNVAGCPDDDPFCEARRLIREFAPQVIGVSLRNIDSTNKRKVVDFYPYFSRLLTEIKILTNASIIAGGAGFSMFAENIMAREPAIDLGVYLEGEKTLAELIENLDQPENVPGVYLRDNGQIRFSGPRRPQAMADLALPDMSALSMESYKAAGEAVGIETKRGCALSCIYCPYGFLNGKTYRRKDPLQVVDEIQSLREAHGITHFTFIDSVFNIPLDHAGAICEELARRDLGMTWSAWFNDREISREFAKLAILAGCRNFIMSPDGFDDRILKALGKSLTRADIVRAFDLLSGFEDIHVSYNFFKNPPGQSLGAFLKLFRFCVAAKTKLKARVHFEFNSLRIEPHTRLHTIALEQGIVGPEDDLIEPFYYTQEKTAWIESLFNLALAVKGK